MINLLGMEWVEGNYDGRADQINSGSAITSARLGPLWARASAMSGRRFRAAVNTWRL